MISRAAQAAAPRSSGYGLPEAAKLYRATGWIEIDRFNDDPYAEVFFEKRL